MTAVHKPKRGNRGSKRLELTDMRAALADGRQWTALGVVVQPDPALPHWEVDGSDVMVEVEIQPTRELLFCRLAAGMFVVPALGEEVIVAIPAGEIEFAPTVLCILSGGAPLYGLSPERIHIVRGEVWIHDGAGHVEPVAKLSELQALAADFYAHGHVETSATTNGPTTQAAPGTMVDPGRVGTNVLKGS